MVARVLDAGGVLFHSGRPIQWVDAVCIGVLGVQQVISDARISVGGGTVAAL